MRSFPGNADGIGGATLLRSHQVAVLKFFVREVAELVYAGSPRVVARVVCRDALERPLEVRATHHSLSE